MIAAMSEKKELERLRAEVERLRAQVDRLTACPGCGKHPRGAHFCPGPDRKPMAYKGGKDDE
jgi:hypothetical protein